MVDHVQQLTLQVLPEEVSEEDQGPSGINQKVAEILKTFKFVPYISYFIRHFIKVCKNPVCIYTKKKKKKKAKI